MVVEKLTPESSTVEDVQDLAECALLEAGELKAARGFIAYRARRAELRPVDHEENGLQDYIAESRYCRFSESLGRREDWSEAVDRVLSMHERRFANLNTAAVSDVVLDLISTGKISGEAVRDAGGFSSLAEEIRNAFELVRAKKVLPSMRSMQFGGKAIEVANARMFNCSFSPANRVSFFREFFYLLLCGCGVGFSVQKQHVVKLPVLAGRGDELDLPVKHVAVADTIEGWADALDSLFESFVKGDKVEFCFSAIRPRGSVLKTSGGKAPGHLPLKRALAAVETILIGSAGRALRPIEVYDICMHVAQAVLSGGIRRSATICLFSADDAEMMAAKTGNWFETHPQRSASNNSAVLVRGSVTREQFNHLFECQKQFGEPGFYFTEDAELGCNPCCEITLNPHLTVTEVEVAKLRAYGYDQPVQVGDVLTGFQMCNLSTIAGSAAGSAEDFFALAKAAAVIGTAQATYTDMPYLGAVTRILNEREALIGVSICGVLDNPDVFLDAGTLQRAAEVVKATNAVIAAMLGINRAARTTCVKPEGTSSLILNSGSGIAPHHARRYFRRVQASTADAVFKWFAANNPHMVEQSIYNSGTAVITFPVEGPKNGVYRDQLSAVRHLEMIRLVQINWVQAGRAVSTYTDGHHNVSNTVNVGEAEWDQVSDFIWENRYSFTGVALLSQTGDKTYKQAPREEVVTDADVRKWNALRYSHVDYREIPEVEDITAGSEHRGAAVACAGGACSLV